VRPLHIAAFTHLLLAFPGGRLEARPGRWLAVASYLNVAILDNVSNVVRHERIAAGFRGVSRLVIALAFVAIVVVLVGRWRAATPARRRVLAPLLWPGTVTLGTLTVFFVNEVAARPLGTAPGWASRVSYAVIPFLLLAGLLRDRLARASVADLVVQIRDPRPPGTLRDALADALGDPSLEVAYWLPEDNRYVDLRGRPVAVPGPHDTRSAVRSAASRRCADRGSARDPPPR
jgi:hypothetical protein